MYDNTAVALAAFNQNGYVDGDREMETQRRAASCFWDLCNAARRERFWARLHARQNKLEALDKALEDQQVRGRYTLGVRAVALAAIVGSEARNDDFDGEFRPLRPHSHGRWLSIFMAHEEGTTLPAVELIRVGKRYFVRDGHHRISVARYLGQMEIDAAVMVWEVAAERNNRESCRP